MQQLITIKEKQFGNENIIYQTTIIDIRRQEAMVVS